MQCGQLKRRTFITLIGGAVAWPLAARAQQLDRMRLIGVLMGFAESDPAAQSWLAAFRNALTQLGWSEGNNLRIEVRWAAADPDRIRTLAKELVDLRPDAIFNQTTPVTDAFARVTQTIPIVFVYVADPVGSGFAASLPRPGRNITGFTYVEPTTGGKWVELLKEIAPRTAHVALLFNPETPRNSTCLPFKLPHHPLPSRRVWLRFTRGTRSRALSPRKRAAPVAVSL